MGLNKLQHLLQENSAIDIFNCCAPIVRSRQSVELLRIHGMKRGRPAPTFAKLIEKNSPEPTSEALARLRMKSRQLAKQLQEHFLDQVGGVVPIKFQFSGPVAQEGRV